MNGTVKVWKQASKQLKAKHELYGSWAAVAEDVGINRGVLCAVANEKRKPSASVLHALGLPHYVTGSIPVCPQCDEPYTPKHHCKAAPPKYGPHPVMRLTMIERLIAHPSEADLTKPGQRRIVEALIRTGYITQADIDAHASSVAAITYKVDSGV